MPISRKQKQIMAFPFTSYDALICDGAIRSGKTVFMMLSFVDDAWSMMWIMEFVCVTIVTEKLTIMDIKQK